MSSRIDRSAVPIRRGRLHDAGPDHAAMPSAEECIGMVWEMTMNAWAFMGHEPQPRLQRHVFRRGRRPSPPGPLSR
jgi:hypothetical protein